MAETVTRLLQRSARGPSADVDVEGLWRRGRQRRRTMRVTGSLVVCAALAVVSAGVVQLWSAYSTTNDVEFVRAQPPGAEAQQPPGWRTVQMAEAEFSVPLAWRVSRQPGPDGELLCLDAGLGGHVVYLADKLYAPPCAPPPPGGYEPAAELAVYALPMDAAGGPHPGGRPFSTGTVEGRMRTVRGLHEYAVPSLNLLLIMGSSEPDVAKRILDSIRPADRGSAPAQGPPSQTPEDVRRDGVMPAVAQLPFRVRVGVVQATQTAGERWVVARLTADEGVTRTTRLGDRGIEGRDYVEVGEYGEILRLDAAGTRIVRAYPFPRMAPQRLLVTADAVYCLHQGDRGLRESVICRIDRATGQLRARAFPWLVQPREPPDGPAVPGSWAINRPLGLALFQRLELRDGQIVVSGRDGSAWSTPRR